MENKYYTPAIEDLHVGYEVEMLSDNKWNRFIFGAGDLATYINYEDYHIRTPYLTKEQIEAEGWEWREVWKAWFKGNWTLDHITFGMDKWRISGGEFSTLHFIIPSINEFRKICKLLGI